MIFTRKHGNINFKMKITSLYIYRYIYNKQTGTALKVLAYSIITLCVNLHVKRVKSNLILF